MIRCHAGMGHMRWWNTPDIYSNESTHLQKAIDRRDGCSHQHYQRRRRGRRHNAIRCHSALIYAVRGWWQFDNQTSVNGHHIAAVTDVDTYLHLCNVCLSDTDKPIALST